jgi:hypothetical protein
MCLETVSGWWGGYTCTGHCTVYLQGIFVISSAKLDEKLAVTLLDIFITSEM